MDTVICDLAKGGTMADNKRSRIRRIQRTPTRVLAEWLGEIMVECLNRNIQVAAALGTAIGKIEGAAAFEELRQAAQEREDAVDQIARCAARQTNSGFSETLNHEVDSTPFVLPVADQGRPDHYPLGPTDPY